MIRQKCKECGNDTWHILASANNYRYECAKCGYLSRLLTKLKCNELGLLG